MSIAQAQTELSLEEQRFNEAVSKFVVLNYTDAPLRMQGQFQFNADAATVFDRMTDPQLIAGWFGMVKGGKLDHSQSCNLDQWGEGSKRYCYTAMGTLNETIHFWEAPYISAYNVIAKSIPTKDHCAVLTVKPVSENSCFMTWQQYFNSRGLVMKAFFPSMMIKMMNQGLSKLAAEFGGAGGKMELAK